MRIIRSTVAIVLSIAAINSVRGADVYKIDPAHTSVGFTITHMMISEVSGRFNDTAGEITLDNGAVTGAKATIQAKSVDTNIEMRDKHLRSPDFFDVEKFPAITFEGEKVEKDGDKPVIVGKFTMHGVTKEIRLPFVLKGPVDAMGKTKIGVVGSLTINRTDYGMKTMKGVGDEVTIKISTEAEKQ